MRKNNIGKEASRRHQAYVRRPRPPFVVAFVQCREVVSQFPSHPKHAKCKTDGGTAFYSFGHKLRPDCNVCDLVTIQFLFGPT